MNDSFDIEIPVSMLPGGFELDFKRFFQTVLEGLSIRKAESCLFETKKDFIPGSAANPTATLIGAGEPSSDSDVYLVLRKDSEGITVPKETYADGLIKLHFAGVMVRLDFMTYQPVETGVPPVPQMAYRLNLPLQRFLTLHATMQKLIDKLVEAGIVIKKS